MNEKYRELFLAESRHHLAGLVEVLGALANDSDAAPATLLDAMFRHLHTLKGMAASMQQGELAELCHRLEDIAATVRTGSRQIDQGTIDAWSVGAYAISEFLDTVESNGPPASLEHAIAQAREVASDTQTQRIEPISRAKLLPTAQKTSRVERATIGFDPDKFDTLLADTDAALLMLATVEGQLPQPNAAVSQLRAKLASIRTTLLDRKFDDAHTIVERYPRLVADLALATGKQASLTVTGDNLRLERRLLEAMDSVLVHLVTNAVDHGIEMPTDRPRRKAAAGQILLDIARDGDDALFTISDDGGGLDQQRIRTVAEQFGLRLPTSIADDRWLEVISLPGFSTRDEATLTSGRGVGLNAVMTTIAQLDGTLRLESAAGQGTKFVIRIPARGAPLPGRMFEVDHARIAVLEADIEPLRRTHPRLVEHECGALQVHIEKGVRPQSTVPFAVGVTLDSGGFPIPVVGHVGG